MQNEETDRKNNAEPLIVIGEKTELTENVIQSKTNAQPTEVQKEKTGTKEDIDEDEKDVDETISKNKKKRRKKGVDQNEAKDVTEEKKGPHDLQNKDQIGKPDDDKAIKGTKKSYADALKLNKANMQPLNELDEIDKEKYTEKEKESKIADEKKDVIKKDDSKLTNKIEGEFKDNTLQPVVTRDKQMKKDKKQIGSAEKNKSDDNRLITTEGAVQSKHAVIQPVDSEKQTAKEKGSNVADGKKDGLKNVDKNSERISENDPKESTLQPEIVKEKQSIRDKAITERDEKTHQLQKTTSQPTVASEDKSKLAMLSSQDGLIKEDNMKINQKPPKKEEIVEQKSLVNEEKVTDEKLKDITTKQDDSGFSSDKLEPETITSQHVDASDKKSKLVKPSSQDNLINEDNTNSQKLPKIKDTTEQKVLNEQTGADGKSKGTTVKKDEDRVEQQKTTLQPAVVSDKKSKQVMPSSHENLINEKNTELEQKPPVEEDAIKQKHLDGRQQEQKIEQGKLEGTTIKTDDSSLAIKLEPEETTSQPVVASDKKLPNKDDSIEQEQKFTDGKPEGTPTTEDDTSFTTKLETKETTSQPAVASDKKSSTQENLAVEENTKLEPKKAQKEDKTDQKHLVGGQREQKVADGRKQESEELKITTSQPDVASDKIFKQSKSSSQENIIKDEDIKREHKLPVKEQEVADPKQEAFAKKADSRSPIKLEELSDTASQPLVALDEIYKQRKPSSQDNEIHEEETEIYRKQPQKEDATEQKYSVKGDGISQLKTDQSFEQPLGIKKKLRDSTDAMPQADNQTRNIELGSKLRLKEEIPDDEEREMAIYEIDEKYNEQYVKDQADSESQKDVNKLLTQVITKQSSETFESKSLKDLADIKKEIEEKSFESTSQIIGKTKTEKTGDRKADDEEEIQAPTILTVTEEIQEFTQEELEEKEQIKYATQSESGKIVEKPDSEIRTFQTEEQKPYVCKAKCSKKPDHAHITSDVERPKFPEDYMQQIRQRFDDASPESIPRAFEPIPTVPTLSQAQLKPDFYIVDDNAVSTVNRISKDNLPLIDESSKVHRTDEEKEVDNTPTSGAKQRDHQVNLEITTLPESYIKEEKIDESIPRALFPLQQMKYLLSHNDIDTAEMEIVLSESEIKLFELPKVLAKPESKADRIVPGCFSNKSISQKSLEDNIRPCKSVCAKATKNDMKLKTSATRSDTVIERTVRRSSSTEYPKTLIETPSIPLQKVEQNMSIRKLKKEDSKSSMIKSIEIAKLSENLPQAIELCTASCSTTAKIKKVTNSQDKCKASCSRRSSSEQAKNTKYTAIISTENTTRSSLKNCTARCSLESNKIKKSKTSDQQSSIKEKNIRQENKKEKKLKRNSELNNENEEMKKQTVKQPNKELKLIYKSTTPKKCTASCSRKLRHRIKKEINLDNAATSISEQNSVNEQSNFNCQPKTVATCLLFEDYKSQTNDIEGKRYEKDIDPIDEQNCVGSDNENKSSNGEEEEESEDDKPKTTFCYMVTLPNFHHIHFQRTFEPIKELSLDFGPIQFTGNRLFRALSGDATALSKTENLINLSILNNRRSRTLSAEILLRRVSENLMYPKLSPRDSRRNCQIICSKTCTNISGVKNEVMEMRYDKTSIQSIRILEYRSYFKRCSSDFYMKESSTNEIKSENLKQMSRSMPVLQWPVKGSSHVQETLKTKKNHIQALEHLQERICTHVPMKIISNASTEMKLPQITNELIPRWLFLENNHPSLPGNMFSNSFEDALIPRLIAHSELELPNIRKNSDVPSPFDLSNNTTQSPEQEFNILLRSRSLPIMSMLPPNSSDKYICEFDLIKKTIQNTTDNTPSIKIDNNTSKKSYDNKGCGFIEEPKDVSKSNVEALKMNSIGSCNSDVQLIPQTTIRRRGELQDLHMQTDYFLNAMQILIVHKDSEIVALQNALAVSIYPVLNFEIRLMTNFVKFKHVVTME